MKKLFMFLILSLSVFLSGCKGFYVNQAIKAPDRQFERKLPYLEPVFENEKQVKHWNPGEKLVRENSHWATLFYRDVEKNLIEPRGEKKGYIVLRPIIHQQEAPNLGWYLLSIATLTIPNWFGMPFFSFTSFAELEMDILNKNGELIKRYSSEVEDTEYSAMWWGYFGRYALDASFYKSYSEALGDIISQAHQDKDYLIKNLK